MGGARPDFSIVMVSDRGAGDPKSWDYLRGTLQVLANQTYRGPVEYILVEHDTIVQHVPSEFLSILPAARIVRSPSNDSFGLKNHGVREARAEIVVILDTDCRPEPDWLQRLADAWRRFPDAAAISGHTEYPGESAIERVLSLLSRAYVDPGATGETRYVSNNNSSWRRRIFLAHPLPEQVGPFCARIQSEAVIRTGGRLLYTPEIRVIHEFEGWAMEMDQRKNIGYGAVIARLKDAQMPYARLVRAGRVSIPVIAAGRMIDQWWDALRCWRHFHLRFDELLLTLLLVPMLVFKEVPGMLSAFAHRPIGHTEWR